MDKQLLEELIDKANQGIATDEELARLNAYLEQAIAHNDTWNEQIMGSETEVMQDVFDRIKRKTQPAPVYRLWLRIAAAASIILMLSAGIYFIFRPAKPQQLARVEQDIAPAGNRATLTLSNGQKIILTGGLRGKLAQQGKTLVKVNGGNSIVYIKLADAGDENEPVQYNTLTTMRGEQSPYPLILADGTKVWLNAASSITFPTAFTGKERRVQITGEAYFDVVHNPRQPFYVAANGETVQDIGTEFNINAYTDEPAIVTTLIKGSVGITKARDYKKLSPGQQSVIMANDDNIQVQQADLEQALAWKTGLFVFNNESLESIMRKVSRWYNVDVIYKDVDKNKLFWGSMSRYNNISQALRQLELTGEVHFIIEGRRLIATK